MIVREVQFGLDVGSADGEVGAIHIVEEPRDHQQPEDAPFLTRQGGSVRPQNIRHRLLFYTVGHALACRFFTGQAKAYPTWAGPPCATSQCAFNSAVQPVIRVNGAEESDGNELIRNRPSGATSY